MVLETYEIQIFLLFNEYSVCEINGMIFINKMISKTNEIKLFMLLNKYLTVMIMIKKKLKIIQKSKNVVHENYIFFIFIKEFTWPDYYFHAFDLIFYKIIKKLIAL